MLEVKLTPTKELFFNEENFFGIYGAEPHQDFINELKVNRWGTISVKGSIPRLKLNEEYTMVIEEEVSSKYEGSYNIISIKKDRPKTAKEQRSFLSAILTERQVDNIYKVYNEEEDVVGLIIDNKFEYEKVDGIGIKTFGKIKEKVIENIELSQVLSFISKYGIKYGAINKLLKEYKSADVLIQKIETNPYILTEVKGVGFKKADQIAMSIGIEVTSDMRIHSCIRHCLSEDASNGHTYATKKSIISKAVELLTINNSYIIDALNKEIKGVVDIGDERFALKYLLQAEKDVAMHLMKYNSNTTKIVKRNELDEFLEKYCDENNVSLTDEQQEFFHNFNENNVSLLIGYGGCGKSWVVKILLQFLKSKSKSVKLLSPTGRAGKVLSNYTEHEASTIHRAVGIGGEDEEEDGGRNSIEEDVIVVDETSMCDVLLFKKLLSSVGNENVKILLIGDDFQLPSVGAGNLLYDLINSGIFVISRLTKVFRQSSGGMLNVSTDTRLSKQYIENDADGRIVYGKDCVFWSVDSTHIRSGLIANYKKALEKFSANDIVVITPTKKGNFGTIKINKEIQGIVNPKSEMKKEKTFTIDGEEVVFREGDAVMNVVNTYEMETVDGKIVDVFNGDTGKIFEIDEDKKRVIVKIDKDYVVFDIKNISTSLIHGWCSTIHKQQGSQIKVVICVIDKSMTYQLNANLLYTAFSRAKEYMLVLTQGKTINSAMKKFANMERRSMLQQFLNGFVAHLEM